MRSRAGTVDAAPIDTLARLVATFPARGPKVAVLVCRGDEAIPYTYAELAADVERRAHELRALGVVAGDRVALWAPNGWPWITACFGVVCTGATVVPLDFQMGADAAATLLEHAAPKVLLGSGARITELGGRLAARAIALDSDEWTRPAPAGAASAAAVDVGADAIASLVYTSGTTGVPKGVPLTHSNLLANVRALGSAALIESDERVLLPLPLHHTYPFTVGLLTVLYRGATVVLPAGISGPEISRAAQLAQATAMLAVPRLAAALWDSVLAAVRARGSRAERAFHTLLRISGAVTRATGWHLGRLLFRAVHARLGGRLAVLGCGGAKLDPELAARLEALGFKVLTGYGLTETSPVLTFNDRRHARLGTEGRALTGVEISIAAAPGDASGEIRARGPNVFTGYWHNPTATAAAFTSDGWFKTGDLGSLDRDGYLTIVGRSKELIVLADGKKLFPEELEKLYTAAAPIREIAILEQDGRLAALIVPDEDVVRERGALREAAMIREELEDIGARLAPYQRIRDYRVTRVALPRTQLGKLKRHLLPELYAAAAVRERPAAAAEVAAHDAELLARAQQRGVWQWLQARYPDVPLALDTSPQIDLEIDSLAWVSLTLEIEQRFGTALTGDAVSRILSLRDLLREIETAPPAAAAADAVAAPAYAPPGRFMRTVGALLYFTARVLVRSAFRVEVSGAERLPAAGGYVLAPNHSSYLDPLVLAAALPWRALRDVYWAGWVGVMHTSALRRFVSRATRVFPVDPDRDLAGAIETARGLLRQGRSIVWFPEGRRSPTGEVLPFQLGIGLLLARTGAAAVPAAIGGTFEAWPKHRAWPVLGQPLRVAFGTPIAAAAPPEAVVARLEQAVQQLAAGATSCDR